MDKPDWADKHYAFFQNTQCEYFPCHGTKGSMAESHETKGSVAESHETKGSMAESHETKGSMAESHETEGSMAESHGAEDSAGFNCLFCYCPLYALGRDCGGNFTYLEGGIKDCSGCLLPHRPQSYGYITSRFGDICRAMADLECQRRDKESS